MKRAAAGANAGSRRELRSAGRQWAAGLACCIAAASGWAQELQPQDTRSPEPGLRMEMNASALPRLDSQDTGFQAPRLDLSLLPQSRSAVGPVVGVAGYTPNAASPSTFAAAPRTALDLGVHLRHTTDGNRQIDVTAWRRMTAEPDAYTLIQRQQPTYGARVEMRLAPVNKTGFRAESGFIGMQLEGGAKISIRRKNGVPMLYYRNTF